MQPYINPNYYSQLQAPYNPPVYAPQQPTPQLARIVQDFNGVTIGDIPTNGTPGFFIKADYTEIQARQWGEDGRINVITYKPETAAAKPDPFQEILQRLDAIEEKVTPKTTRKKVESDE